MRTFKCANIRTYLYLYAGMKRLSCQFVIGSALCGLLVIEVLAQITFERTFSGTFEDKGSYKRSTKIRIVARIGQASDSGQWQKPAG